MDEKEYQRVIQVLGDPHTSPEERMRASVRLNELMEIRELERQAEMEKIRRSMAEELSSEPKKRKRSDEDETIRAEFRDLEKEMERNFREAMEKRGTPMEDDDDDCPDGMPDMSKLMAGGMPDISKMMAGMGMQGMPDISKMMAGMGMQGMPDMSKMFSGMGAPDMTQTPAGKEAGRPAADAGKNKTDDEETRVRKAISINKNDPDLYSELGMILFEKGDTKGAQEAMEMSLKIRQGGSP